MLLQEVHEVDLLARGEQVADCRLALIDVEKARLEHSPELPLHLVNISEGPQDELLRALVRISMLE